MANINHKPSKYMLNLLHVLPTFTNEKKDIVNTIVEINLKRESNLAFVKELLLFLGKALGVLPTLGQIRSYGSEEIARFMKEHFNNSDCYCEPRFGAPQLEFYAMLINADNAKERKEAFLKRVTYCITKNDSKADDKKYIQEEGKHKNRVLWASKRWEN